MNFLVIKLNLLALWKKFCKNGNKPPWPRNHWTSAYHGTLHWHNAV